MCLFTAHDLATVEYLCERVAVTYLGKIVELASTTDLFAAPKHRWMPASHEVEPPLVEVGGGRHVACHLVGSGGEAPRLLDVAEVAR